MMMENRFGSSSRNTSRWERSEEKDQRNRRDRYDDDDDNIRRRRRREDEYDDINKRRNTSPLSSSKQRRRSQSPKRIEEFKKDREKEINHYNEKYQLKNEINNENKSNFSSSGILAKESNQKNGINLKYFEPPEARKPKEKWRLYYFESGLKKESKIFKISNQSCYLFGRDLKIVDIEINHKSSSKQHCVLQFRNVIDKDSTQKNIIKPFLIDLNSSNGTFVNKIKIPKSRFYELHSGDIITIAASLNDYVLLKED